MAKVKKVHENGSSEREVIVVNVKATQAIRGRTRKREGSKGLLFTLCDVIKVNLHEYTKVYRNNEDMQIIIEGSTLPDVKNAMANFYSGSNEGGHGGGKIKSYEVRRKIIDSLEHEKNKIRLSYQDEIEELRRQLEDCKSKLS